MSGRPLQAPGTIDDLHGLPNRASLYSPVGMYPRRRIRFRPPGVKPWTRIGALGPFRGRLGLPWVIAPLVLGVVLLAFGWLLLFRCHPRIHPPGGSFMPVATLASLGSGARSPTLPDGRVISYVLTT